jgi:hypothetical protein
VALIGTGLCWLMFSGERRRREVWEGRYSYEAEDLDHEELQSYRSYDESPGLKAAAGGGRADAEPPRRTPSA